MREMPDEPEVVPALASLVAVDVTTRHRPDCPRRTVVMDTTSDRHLVDPRSGAAAAVGAAIFAVGIVLGTLIIPGAPAVGSPVAVPVGDRSYDALEETRADRGLSVPVGDRSYDALEETRADRGLSGPVASQDFETLRKIHAERGTD